jgi:hypothetical protein
MELLINVVMIMLVVMQLVEFVKKHSKEQIPMFVSMKFAIPLKLALTLIALMEFAKDNYH